MVPIAAFVLYSLTLGPRSPSATNAMGWRMSVSRSIKILPNMRPGTKGSANFIIILSNYFHVFLLFTQPWLLVAALWNGTFRALHRATTSGATGFPRGARQLAIPTGGASPFLPGGEMFRLA